MRGDEWLPAQWLVRGAYRARPGEPARQREHDEWHDAWTLHRSGCAHRDTDGRNGGTGWARANDRVLGFARTHRRGVDGAGPKGSEPDQRIDSDGGVGILPTYTDPRKEISMALH